ncbi:MAG: VOC family protein [Planctomycetes bacterium]|nr:VOC family protein [Planctomycetota bacterium]
MLQEHIAFNVEEPAAMVDWYCTHLGLAVVKDTGAAFFIADDSGHGILEIYNNPAAEVPDYANMDPLLVHIAFVSEDVDADEARLIAAGATKYKETIREGGDTVSILRDPWGLAIQLCKRGTPMV